MTITSHFNECIRDEADLLELEIQIARRADQLARQHLTDRDHDDDLRCWLEAEEDVLSSGVLR